MGWVPSSLESHPIQCPCHQDRVQIKHPCVLIARRYLVESSHPLSNPGEYGHLHAPMTWSKAAFLAPLLSWETPTGVWRWLMFILLSAHPKVSPVEQRDGGKRRKIGLVQSSLTPLTLQNCHEFYIIDPHFLPFSSSPYNPQPSNAISPLGCACTCTEMGQASAIGHISFNIN